MHRSILILIIAAVLLTPQSKDATLEVGRLYRLDFETWGKAETPLRVSEAGRVLLDKKLGPYDPTASLYFRASTGKAPVANLPYRIERVRDASATESSSDSARPVQLEWDRSYRALNAEQPYFTAPPEVGQHWYQIKNPSGEAREVLLSVEVEDRDLPSDIETFVRAADGDLTIYREGAHNYVPESTQTMPGYSSFRARRVEAGQELLIRVTANHPAYGIRIKSYPVAGARTPRQAVELGMDTLVSLGASWHANVPRRGAAVTRATLQHPEIQGCVACHPTLFALRGYDAARGNGYGDVQASAAETLHRQLVNNPRPFPGLNGVTWARTIFSVRAVSARMASHVPGAVGFLHHTDPTLDAEEADGAPPNVSPFEIAYEAWKATKLAPFASQLQSLTVRNVVDLNWKIVAYSAMKLPTAKLVDELWSWQREDGLFPYHLDRSEAGAEFITWHALYALAKAGLTLQDPRVAKLAKLCVARQGASGAWQGEPAHKAFHTPFRDTQFAVMALSTLYPAGEQRVVQHGKQKLDLAGEGPAGLRAALRNVYLNVRAAADLELLRRGQVLSVINRGAKSEYPLVRFEAARAAARLFPLLVDSAAGEEILGLVTQGIRAEVEEPVMMAWQQALYAAIDENQGYLETWIQQLASPDEQQKARDGLANRQKRLQGVLATALSQSDDAARVRLLNAMWDYPQRHSGLPADWEKRTEIVLPAYFSEYQQGIRKLDQSYEPYLQNRSFRYAAGNPFFKTRVGNDSDLPDLGKPGVELEQELVKALRAANRDVATSAIKALSVFPQGTTPALTNAVLPHLAGELSTVARYVFESDARGTLSLETASAEQEAKLADGLLRVLEPAHRDALETLLPALAKLTPGDGVTRQPFVQGRMERLLLRPEGVPLDKALAAAAVFPHIADGPLMRTTMLEAFGSGDRRLQSAAVEIFIKSYIAEPTNPVLAKQFSAKSSGNVRRMMIDGLDPSRFALRLSALNRYNPGRDVVLPEDANLFSSDVAQHLVQLGLKDEDRSIQLAASELVARYPELAQFRSLVRHMERRAPDFDTFVNEIQPLLVQPGADGRACAMCHATQAKFPLRLPGKTGFTAAQSRFNYESVLREVNAGDPKSSLLLIKPTRPNDNAGDPALHTSTHGGGTRWGRNTIEGTASLEYEKILRWIRGSK